jgi:outer membrane autotransporter protein
MEDVHGSADAGFKTLRAALICAAAAWVMAPAVAGAQAVYDRQIVYGDSYADNGNVVNNSFFSPSQPYPRHVTTNVSFLTFLVYPTPLQGLLNIPDAGMLDYAFGGATTGPGIPGIILGYQQQIDASLTLGQTFGPRDLVTINIGGNDGGASSGGVSVANAPGVAATATTNLAAGVQTLFNHGARNFMISTFDDTSVIPDIVNGSHGQGAIAGGKVYGADFFAGEQAKLAPIAQAGARIFTFNLSQLAREIAVNPSGYGFTNLLTPCQGTPGCATPTSPGQFTSATFDGLHLTTGAFLVVAKYMANLLDAPALYPSEADLTQTTAANFSTDLLGRLERTRDAGSAAGPWSVYGDFTGAGGTRGGRLDATGYNYHGAGGDLGVEYQAGPNARLGLMGNYAGPKLDLAGGSGQIAVDAYQIAGYASFSYPHAFLDVEGAYGRSQYKLTRPGVISPVSGSTHADSVTVAAKTGYLFDLKPVRIGPILGLNYTSAQVGSFTEAGDPLLTYAVGPQGLDALTGSAGVQVRLPGRLYGHAFDPYLDLTAEHNFMRGDESLVVTETQSAALPIVTDIRGAGEQTYGRVQAGVSAAIAGAFSADAAVSTTVGRKGGDDYIANLGLTYRF